MTMLEFKRSGDVFARRIPIWKRAIDIIGASVVLVCASPVMILTALWIKAVSRGPVFFKQSRIGLGGREFTMWKFRTMHEHTKPSERHRAYMAELIRGEDDSMVMAKLDEENPAIIPLGGLLRKSCIDELPQLFNVLMGEMSLVGPRPVIPYEVSEFVGWHFGRFDVLPGLTGLWQVRGKNKLTFKEMIRLDVRYARTVSPALDFEIIMRTPMVIIGQLAGRGDTAVRTADDKAPKAAASTPASAR